MPDNINNLGIQGGAANLSITSGARNEDLLSSILSNSSGVQNDYSSSTGNGANTDLSVDLGVSNTAIHRPNSEVKTYAEIEAAAMADVAGVKRLELKPLLGDDIPGTPGNPKATPPVPATPSSQSQSRISENRAIQTENDTKSVFNTELNVIIKDMDAALTKLGSSKSREGYLNALKKVNGDKEVTPPIESIANRLTALSDKYKNDPTLGASAVKACDDAKAVFRTQDCNGDSTNVGKFENKSLLRALKTEILYSDFLKELKKIGSASESKNL